MSIEVASLRQEPPASSALSVRRAAYRDIKSIAVLFDAYRRFDNRAPNVSGAENYLRARFENDESVLFVAERAPAEAVRFCQLYPAFCSLGGSGAICGRARRHPTGAVHGQEQSAGTSLVRINRLAVAPRAA